MANFFRRSCVNSTEGEDIEKVMQNWNPPKVPVNQIYKRRGIFESNKNSMIETTEGTVIIQGEYQDLQLHDRNSIQRYKQNYDYLHMGLVQVAIKPLTANGLNNSVLVSLRDCRHLNFNNSRLAVAEFSLNNGPVYFNCYPSYTVSLTDPHILTTLTLNLKINGFNSEHQGSRDIAVAYKVYHKLLTVMGDTKERRRSISVDNTTFIETNLVSNKVPVQRTTAWDSVEIPERWSAR